MALEPTKHTLAEQDLPADISGPQTRRDGLNEYQLAVVRQSVKQGIDDIAQGRFKVFDEAGLREHSAEIGRRGRRRLEAETAKG